MSRFRRPHCEELPGEISAGLRGMQRSAEFVTTSNSYGGGMRGVLQDI